MSGADPAPKAKAGHPGKGERPRGGCHWRAQPEPSGLEVVQAGACRQGDPAGMLAKLLDSVGSCGPEPK